jgi:hypothetical protein
MSLVLFSVVVLEEGVPVVAGSLLVAGALVGFAFESPLPLQAARLSTITTARSIARILFNFII